MFCSYAAALAAEPLARLPANMLGLAKSPASRNDLLEVSFPGCLVNLAQQVLAQSREPSFIRDDASLGWAGLAQCFLGTPTYDARTCLSRFRMTSDVRGLPASAGCCWTRSHIALISIQILQQER